MTASPEGSGANFYTHEGYGRVRRATLFVRRASCNAARIPLAHELRADGLKILKLLEKGSHVECGVHTAEVEEAVDRDKIVKRLLVDGRPVEDW